MNEYDKAIGTMAALKGKAEEIKSAGEIFEAIRQTCLPQDLKNNLISVLDNVGIIFDDTPAWNVLSINIALDWTMERIEEYRKQEGVSDGKKIGSTHRS